MNDNEYFHNTSDVSNRPRQKFTFKNTFQHTRKNSTNEPQKFTLRHTSSPLWPCLTSRAFPLAVSIPRTEVPMEAIIGVQSRRKDILSRKYSGSCWLVIHSISALLCLALSLYVSISTFVSVYICIYIYIHLYISLFIYICRLIIIYILISIDN